MRKSNRILCFLLSLVLLSSLSPLAYAQEEGITLRIISRDGFLNFAENCRLDSYSQGLTVILCNDIDLSGADFEGIPIFCGSFEGNGHTISGLNLESPGSGIGLFRYLTDTATVKNLHVSGCVNPGGTGAAAGGIVGTNGGTLQDCSFEGAVSGTDSIGGLVGINLLSGVIDGCQAFGSIYGNHFVGGIAGDNYGVIRNCENHGEVNTTVEQNEVELENINLDSIINSEAAQTVTDIGGICGTGTGVVQSCINHGSIGYPQIGYNIGGIAGSFSGYIYNCINRGNVDGRKEIGGIVGQLEPAVNMIYEEDTLQTLQQQMDDLSNAANGIGGSIQSGSNALNSQSQRVETQLKDAQDALEMLIPKDTDNPTMPDEETLQAARNALSSSLSDLTGSISAMAEIGQNTFSNVAGSLQGVSSQMNAISSTISNASENLGGGIQDVSDADTAQDQTAKVRACFNLGSVHGDWNIGGVVGTIGLENDLDPEADLQIVGNTSLNFDMQLRAVVLDCENRGAVSGKKQNVGGVVGWASMGLVRHCVNAAAVDAASADYIGGIAGQSSGFLRGCSAKCSIAGDTYVGGIAGSGTTVTDCKAILLLEGATEKYGAILGFSEEPDLASNYYLVGDSDPGAVDGISYDTQAQPLPSDRFFALVDLPASFRLVSVTFVFDDLDSRRITLPYGCVLTRDLIPAVPQQSGSDAHWIGPLEIGQQILHDAVFRLESTAHTTTLESELRTGNGLPVLLLQGQFQKDAQLGAAVLPEPGAVAAWTIALPESAADMKLRCRIPDGCDPTELKLQLRVGSDWQDAGFTVDGSYLVFAVTANTNALRILRIGMDYTWYYIAGAAGLVLTLGIVITLCKRRKKTA